MKKIALQQRLLVFLLLLLSYRLSAQPVSASIPDDYVDIHNMTAPPCSTDAVVFNATSLNADMITTVSNNQLFAVAYTMQDIGMRDPNPTPPTFTPCIFFTNTPTDITGIHVELNNPFFGFSFGPYNKDVFINGKNPDVVIGNQAGLTYHDNYIIGVVYENGNDVEIATCIAYDIDNGNTPSILGALSAGITLNDPSNGRIAKDVHIDMFGEPYAGIGGGPYPIQTLFKFIATWTEHDPAPGGYDYVMVAVGDINNPSAFVRTQITPNSPGDPQGVTPDVAAMGVLHPCGTCAPNKAFLTYVDPSNGDALMETELDIDVSYSASVVGTPTALATGHFDIGKPRIESKNLGDIVTSEATWEIVASIQPVSANYEIHTFNDVVTTPVVCTLSSSDNHFSPAVTGVGEDMDNVGSGKVGETQFSIAYYSTYTNSGPGNGDIFVNSIDISGGLMTNTNYYEANFSDLLQPTAFSSPNDIPVAISSSSNSGEELLTVWYMGYDPSIAYGGFGYKLSGNGYSFKTNGVFDVKINSLNIYPNPASDILNIKNVSGSSYSIINMFGQVLKNGNINSNQYKADITDLSPGVYVLNVDNIKNVRFTKN